jgi:hypothetical protein
MTDQWDSFAKELIEPVAKNDDRLREKALKKLPTGKEAGVEWDGDQGEIRTGPTTNVPNDWSGLLEMWDLDPAEVEIVGAVRRSSWEAQTPDGLQVLNSYRASIRRKVLGSDTDLEKLCEEISKYKPKKSYTGPDGNVSYLHCTADTQLGKDDPDWAWGRFSKGITDGISRLEELRSIKRRISTVYLPWVGDCIESVSGHYPNQQFSVFLSTTEQVRLFRRFLTAQVKAYAPLCKELYVPSVPGNHDEASRVNGKQATNNSDSWAIDVASQVSDALAENPDVFGHVSFIVPKRDQLTISLDISGTPTGFAHGHQFGRDWRKWWADQAHGCQDVGNTTLLIAGHKHHYMAKTEGTKTFLQCPSQDNGSQYWTDKTGQSSAPGIVTLTVGGGTWDDFKII